MGTRSARTRAVDPLKPARRGGKKKASARLSTSAVPAGRAHRTVAVVLADLAEMADAIRSWRVANGRTQARFAEELGVRRPTLAFWELGRGRPDILSAVAIEAVTDGELKVETFGYSAEHAIKLARLRNTAPPEPAAAE